MCLTVNKKFKNKASARAWFEEQLKVVTEEDMTVWKVLCKTAAEGVFRSPYYEEIYDFRTTNLKTSVIEIENLNYYGNLEIGKGLHCYAVRSTLLGRARVVLFDTLFSLTIPKGSVVFYGINGDIVTNQLILKKDEKVTKALQKEEAQITRVPADINPIGNMEHE